MDQINVSKLTATQNIIRKKFENAYKIRVEHENNVNQAIKPVTPSTILLTNDSEVEIDDFPNQSFESRVIHPNELCNNLRKLLASQIVDNVNRTHEINSIIEQLRELKIII